MCREISRHIIEDEKLINIRDEVVKCVESNKTPTLKDESYPSDVAIVIKKEKKDDIFDKTRHYYLLDFYYVKTGTIEEGIILKDYLYKENSVEDFSIIKIINIDEYKGYDGKLKKKLRHYGFIKDSSLEGCSDMQYLIYKDVMDYGFDIGEFLTDTENKIVNYIIDLDLEYQYNPRYKYRYDDGFIFVGGKDALNTIGVSYQTINKSLNRLVEYKVLEVDKRYDEKKDTYFNKYRLNTNEEEVKRRNEELYSMLKNRELKLTTNGNKSKRKMYKLKDGGNIKLSF